MKIHPTQKKRSITTSVHGVDSSTQNSKKLRRLPHVFAKVLELPLQADADVAVQENSDSFWFVAPTENTNKEVQAHAIEICPGVTKIIIRGIDGGDLLEDDIDFDLWRFRLPDSTDPRMASARCCGRELIVTVPKAMNYDDFVWGERAWEVSPCSVGL